MNGLTAADDFWILFPRSCATKFSNTQYEHLLLPAQSFTINSSPLSVVSACKHIFELLRVVHAMISLKTSRRMFYYVLKILL